MNCESSDALHGAVKKKLELLFYLTKIVHWNGKNTHTFTNELCIKVSVARCSHLEIFPPEKLQCRHASASCLQNVYCLLFRDKTSGRKKNYVSGSFWDLTFHSNGKISSFPEHIRELLIKVSITHRSHLVYFLRGKVLCIAVLDMCPFKSLFWSDILSTWPDINLHN